jgi:CDP-diacylglycerol--glycerol-3-phosphate 3-phosphatidyltransferase
VARDRLTARRLVGLDRSGPPPPETRAGAPLRPWTLPNLIGYVRLALIPVFLVVALGTRDGRSAIAAVLFAVIGWGDYLDGITARVTRQYSRMGALLDPVVDRLLVVAGLVVCWRFELLPRWALAVLAVRELLMLAAGRYFLSRGGDIAINWPGRLAVAPVMGAPFFAMAGAHGVALGCLYVGMALALLATALYVRDGRRQLSPQGAPKPQADLDPDRSGV